MRDGADAAKPVHEDNYSTRAVAAKHRYRHMEMRLVAVLCGWPFAQAMSVEGESANAHPHSIGTRARVRMLWNAPFACRDP